MLLNETIAAHDQIILSYYTNLILILLIQKLWKRFSVKEREIIRKHIKNFTVKNPNANRAEIVNHLSKKGIARTIYNNMNKLGTLQSKKDYKETVDFLHGHLLNLNNSKDW